MEENKIICSHCGVVIDDDDYEEVNGQVVCDAAIYNTDENIAKLSWSEFVSGITEPELITYLKERRLYINEPINEEEDD